MELAGYRDLPFDFDPMPVLEELDLPLAAHGEADVIVPAQSSAATITALRAKGRPFTAVVYPAVGHVLHTETGAPSRSWEAPDAYWTEMQDWLMENTMLP